MWEVWLGSRGLGGHEESKGIDEERAGSAGSWMSGVEEDRELEDSARSVYLE